MNEETQEGTPSPMCNHESDCNCGTSTSGTPAPQEHEGKEEIALAFLLALMPLVVLTFFGQVGLI